MAAIESSMMPLGTAAPDFALPDTRGGTVSLRDFGGGPLVVMFICNHCPFVKHVAAQLKQIADEYGPRGVGGVGFVAINSNDAAAYPDDSPQKMVEEKRMRGYPFPYLYDGTQGVARAYTAACTPDFFLFDADHELVYRGQLDPTRPHRISSGYYDSSQNPATGGDLRRALDAVLRGETPDPDQRPSVGCNIKWKQP